MAYSNLKVLLFVRTPDEFGLGKLVEIRGTQGRVRFRHSTASTEDRCYRLEELERGYLSPQMRVFWQAPGTSVWKAGRVIGYFRDDGFISYEVQFPNGKVHDIPEMELETRSMKPNEDPTPALAEGWSETQFFYDRRLVALRALIHARAISWGLTGLTSASIDLLPHQVEIVRRVLSDPIQRYLLADEVGMGKTIEAGCIIRQILLDDAKERVVVLTPVSLVRQWQDELARKFAVDELPGRVVVRPFEALQELLPNEFETLVIDEAHHLVGKSGSDPAAHQERYNHLKGLAHACRRLFVLTATPVLGDEQAMLRLLHLLDPQAHPLHDLESFRLKLRNRQEYGRLLMSLNPSAPSFMLKLFASQLRDSFPGDEQVADLAGKLEAPTRTDEAAETVRVLKRHIADTYRLHQRLLRTRRKDLAGWEMADRKGVVQVMSDPSRLVEQLADLLEEWRYRAQVFVRQKFDGVGEEGLERTLADRFLRLFEAMGRSGAELQAELETQQKAVAAGRTPAFPEEQGLVDTMRQLLAEEADELAELELAGDAVQGAIAAVKVAITGAPKVVAFSSSTRWARLLADYLGSVLGKAQVYAVLSDSSGEAVHEAVQEVRAAAQPMVLVCDPSGEEGLNLHFMDAVVHLDLPLSPARLEQRIGRVDRFGRKADKIRHEILLPTDDESSPWMAWQTLLRDGFMLYDSSISDVQFLLESVQAELTLRLFRTGYVGFTDSTSWVRETLETERKRVNEQYALDQLSLADAESAQAFQSLDDGDHQDNFLKLNEWLFEAVRFRRQCAGQDTFFLKWEDKHTLIPDNPWREVFGAALDRKLTYNRTLAVRQPEVRLIRPGAPLVSALERHLLWDDRGSSFATWRVDPRWTTGTRGEWFGIRLSYVVEFDMKRLALQLAGNLDPYAIQAVRRRADAFFTPWVETLTLDPDLEPVADPLILEILERPYLARKQGGSDYNLGSRREALFQLITEREFHNLCKQVRDRSEELIWGSDRFKQQMADAVKHAHTELYTRNQYLERRQAALHRVEGLRDLNLDREMAINAAMLETLSAPHVRLDAIGCLVISDRAPEVGAQ